jgi:hypothetical protein
VHAEGEEEGLSAKGTKRGARTCEKCHTTKTNEHYRLSKFNRFSRVCNECGHRCKECVKNSEETAFYVDRLGRLSTRCKVCHSTRNAARQRERHSKKIHICVSCGLDSHTVEFYRRANGYLKQPCAPCQRENAAERSARNAEARRSTTPILRVIDDTQMLAARFLRMPRVAA